jgi:hypothetical protein
VDAADAIVEEKAGMDEQKTAQEGFLQESYICSAMNEPLLEEEGGPKVD